ncbi:MAG: hypothetical protein ACXVLQ_17540 [Bacteriovorax sp.]
MNKLFLGLLLILSFSALAGEISTTKCQVIYNLETGFIEATNNIDTNNASAFIVNKNCLDLKDADIQIDGISVNGILIKYLTLKH